MFVGAAILVSIHYPMWHSGQVQILTAYKAFTNKKLNATLGVKIGLKHVNITLTNKDHNQFSLFALMKENNHENIMSYNERVDFLHVNSMEKELENALYKGLPYPILKVIEYLSVDRAGFVWGRRYRLAGYYTFVILWLAFACWLLQMILLCLLPHYFGKMMCVVGICTIIADMVYFLNTPSNLCIRFPSSDDTMAVLRFGPSHSFHTTIFAGLFSLLVGASIILWEKLTNNRFQTVFSAHIDEMCGLRKPISIPTGCPVESTVASAKVETSSAESFSADRVSTFSTISCVMESDSSRDH
uniref:DUOXA-like protein C06E1.3 n=1 Tax=Panagrellus redivivus TaxID=6233 RepID=A0A7E4W6Y8_PANRE